VAKTPDVHPATTRAVMVPWAEFMAEQLSAGHEIYHLHFGVVKATLCKTTWQTMLRGKEYTIGPRMIISFAAPKYLKKLTVLVHYIRHHRRARQNLRRPRPKPHQHRALLDRALAAALRAGAIPHHTRMAG